LSLIQKKTLKKARPSTLR